MADLWRRLDDVSGDLQSKAAGFEAQDIAAGLRAEVKKVQQDMEAEMSNCKAALEDLFAKMEHVRGNAGSSQASECSTDEPSLMRLVSDLKTQMRDVRQHVSLERTERI